MTVALRSNLERTTAVALLTLALAEAVVAASPDGIPSGHLYAAVMPSGVTMEQYDAAIATLKRTGLVRESDAHVLTAHTKAGPVMGSTTTPSTRAPRAL